MSELHRTWLLHGTSQQIRIAKEAIDASDFPYELMLPSLARENRQSVSVTWEDLSRYGQMVNAAHGARKHESTIQIDGAEAYPLERTVDGRKRVLGLFYLPPYTRVVIEKILVNHPVLAKEVFLSEAAHAVDYHYMLGRGLRRLVWNAMHPDEDDLSEGAKVSESGDINHGHSWFDGPGGYSTWAGESFMEGFVKAFAPTIPVTIKLGHNITPSVAAGIREALLPKPPKKVYWSGPGSVVVHDSHRGIFPVKWFDSLAEAEAVGLRACRVCDPEKNN